MPKSITSDDLVSFLSDGEWQRFFDGNALTNGQKLARAKLTARASAEVLDTGDAELRASVTEKNGDQNESSVFFWWEGDEKIVLESDCTCGSTQCQHGAAVLEYFAKTKTAERLELAFGGAPEADKMTQGKTLQLDEPSTAETTAANLSFLFRVQRRPDRERSSGSQRFLRALLQSTMVNMPFRFLHPVSCRPSSRRRKKSIGIGLQKRKLSIFSMP